MEYKKEIWDFLVLLVLFFPVASPVRIPRNPCPDVFQYYKDTNGLFYGEITLPYDGATSMTLNVNSSFADVSSRKLSLNLTLENSFKQLLTNVSPLIYHIGFPNQLIIPKVTEIKYNGRIYCRGPAEPVIPNTQGVTNSWSQHNYKFVRPSTNFPIEDILDPGMPEDEIPVKDPYSVRPYTPGLPVEHTHTTEHPFTVGAHTDDMPNTSSVPVATSSPRDEIPAAECGVPKLLTVIPRIFGATQTSLGQFPWLVAILARMDPSGGSFRFKCSGTLISAKHVITAGVCIHYYKIQVLETANIILKMGANDLRNLRIGEGVVTRRAVNVQTHPDFIKNHKTAHADMSIITMDAPVRFTDVIGPVCLWSGSTDLSVILNTSGFEVGFGQDGKSATDVATVARYANLRIVPQDYCDSSEIGSSDKIICAGEVGKGPCIGDSGSGFIVQRDNGVYELRGISSVSLSPNDSCDFDKRYGVFCDVAKFRDWVNSCMKD